MLKQARTSISQLLDSLSYMYRSNGINFEVKDYDYVLMRMLSPFELLSQYGIADNRGIFNNTTVNQQKSYKRDTVSK
jgi:hypothetical protein